MKILLAIFFSATMAAQVPSPTGGAVGQAGTFPFRYGTTVAMSDADYALVYPQTAAGFIKFTGTLTATRNITGFPTCDATKINFEIGAENATNQPIMLASTIAVPSGQWGKATCDGSSYISTGGGISSVSSLAAAVAACGSNPTTLLITSPLTPSTLTVPANCTLLFQDGGAINPASGQTVTILGAIQANPNTQIFGGTGGIAGLAVSRPEWFGLTTITKAAYALRSGGTLQLQCATYQSDAGNSSPLTQPLYIEGCGKPSPNSGYTALNGGTIIQGNLDISGSGASYSRVEHLGIDVGSAYVGGSPVDGLGMGGTSSNPLVGGVVNDVVVLGAGSTSAGTIHGIIVQGTDQALIQNSNVSLAYNGIVLKGTNATVRANHVQGSGADAIIIKANDYAPTSQVVVDGNFINSYSACDTTGIVVQSETAAIHDVLVENNVFTGICNATAMQVASELGSFGSHYTYGIQFTNNTVNGGSGDSYGSCVFWNGPAANVVVNGLVCNNIAGAVNMYYANLNDSGTAHTYGVQISNVTGTGLNQAIQTRGNDTQVTNVTVNSFSPAITVQDGNTFAVNVIESGGAFLSVCANGCAGGTAGGNFYLGPYTQAINYFTAPQYFSAEVPAYMQLAGGDSVLSVSAWSITGNVATFTTGTNTLAVGNKVTLSAFGTSTFFNGQTVTVLNAGLSSTQFEANFTHADGSATESGQGAVPTPDYLFWENNPNSDPCSAAIRNTGSNTIPYYGYRICYGIVGSTPAMEIWGAPAGVNGALSYTQYYVFLLGTFTVVATPAAGGIAATCITANCTLQRGSFQVVVSTATPPAGNFLALAWNSTSTPWVCTVSQNGGAISYGIGHDVATATGMNISAANSIASTTFIVDYSCQQ